MVKYKADNNVNDLKKHKRSDRVKWGVVAIVLILLCVAVGGVMASIFTDTKPQDWFKRPQPPVDSDVSLYDEIKVGDELRSVHFDTSYEITDEDIARFKSEGKSVTDSESFTRYYLFSFDRPGYGSLLGLSFLELNYETLTSALGDELAEGELSDDAALYLLQLYPCDGYPLCIWSKQVGYISPRILSLLNDGNDWEFGFLDSAFNLVLPITVEQVACADIMQRFVSVSASKIEMTSLALSSASVLSLETPTEEVFSSFNEVDFNNSLFKGSTWLKETDHDLFDYTASFSIGMHYAESYFSLSSNLYNGRLYVGYLGDSIANSRCAGLLFADNDNVDESFTINLGNWSSSYGCLKIEITDDLMRIGVVRGSSSEWVDSLMKSYSSTTPEYTVVKKYLLEGNCSIISSETNLSDDFSGGSVWEEITLLSYFPDKEPVPLPDDPVKEGHIFVGWYYDAAFTQKYNGEPIYADTVLYAKFIINRYTVNFDSDGGEFVSRREVDWGTVLELPVPNRLGYTLVGWFLSDGTQYIDQPVTSDLSLIARWKVTECIVTFYVDNDVYSSMTVCYGTPLIKVIDEAATMNLQVISVTFEETTVENDPTVIVSDMSVSSVVAEGIDEVVNTIKNNKWKIVGGVVGGIVLLCFIVVVFSGIKRKRR